MQGKPGARHAPDGSPSRTRTYDPGINSPLLYQLSYRGTEPGAAYSPARGRCKASRALEVRSGIEPLWRVLQTLA